MDEMNELPEVDFEEQEKDKKKRGFIPWLKQKLGIGSRGPVGAAGPSGGGLATGAGAGGRMAAGAGRAATGAGRAASGSGAGILGTGGRAAGTGAAGIGRAAGAGGRFFGAAGTGGRFLGAAGSKGGFLGGLLAGKAGTYLAVALIAAGLGIGAFMAMQGSMEKDFSSFNFDKSSGSYVPAIFRGQEDASSLDLLKGANEGFLGEGAEGGKEGEEKGEGEGAQADGAGYHGRYGDAGGYGDGTGGGGESGASPRLPAAGYGKLSSSLDSGKLSAIGGFGNKFGTGAFGPKIDSKFGALGSGKMNIPDSRMGKSFAMKGGKRPVFTNERGKFGALNKYGATPSMQRAYGVRDTQRGFTSGNIDGARWTHDRAWTGGQTGSGGVGDSVGGGGTTTGGGDGTDTGIDTPGIDDDMNVQHCPAGTVGTYPNCVQEQESPTIPSPTTISSEPETLSNRAMKNILIAGIIAIVVALMVKKAKALMTNPYTVTAGIILWVAAIVLAVAALVMFVIPAISDAIALMSKWKQPVLGMVYLLGAGLAAAALTMAMTGQTLGPITAVWAGVAAGVIGLLGSMFTANMTNLPSTSSSTIQQDTQAKGSSSEETQGSGTQE